MIKKLAGALLALWMLAGPAAAEEGALVEFKVLSLDMAIRLATATMKECRAQGYQVAVAVVDRFGVLQVVLRDRFAGPHTPEGARRKAYTAVSFRGGTLGFSEQTQAGMEGSAARFMPGILMLGGGVPVQAAGSIVGAVGVSGAASAAADDACARVGIEEIQADLEF